MTISCSSRKKRGSVLVMAIILAVIVGLAVASMLRLVNQEQRLSRHSAVWAQALHTAEAGVEVAMNEFHKEFLASGTGWSSWTNLGGGILYLDFTNLVSSAYPSHISRYCVTVNTNSLTITSTGRMDVATFSEPVTRVVRITLQTTDWHPFQYAMLAKELVTIQGNADIDSFDSSDPNKSTDGQYDPTKQQTNATVATLSTSDPAIDAKTGDVFGDLATGPGGTVDEGTSFTLHGGGITDNVEMDIPDVTVPFSTALTDPAINGSQTITVSGSKDMSVPQISLGGSKTLTITGTGTLRLYVDGNTTFSGNSKVTMTADPPGSDLNVEIYVNGDMFLNSVVNSPGYAVNLSIYGTPNCSEIEFHGNDTFIATVYAPSVTYKHNGTGAFVGALVADEIQYLGNADFHYDESLATSGSPLKTGYSVSSWLEL